MEFTGFAPESVLVASMHILIYSHGFPNPVEVHRSAFVKEIIRFLPISIQVSVLAPVPFFLNLRRKKTHVHIPHKITELIGDKQVNIYYPRYPLLPKNLLKPVIGYLEAFFTLSRVFYIHKKQRIDLIHVNWAYPDGVAAYCISVLTGVPYVITEHQGAILDLLNESYYNSLIGRVYRKSRKLIIVSPSLKKPLEHIRGEMPKSVVIPNAVDVERYPISKKSPKLSSMVYVGNLIPSKGVAYLLSALSILLSKGNELSLDIIGDGHERACLNQMVEEHGLGAYVRFHGIIPPEKIPEMLIHYDLLVLPTLIESFGMVLIEAMAVGLPVLSTYSGGPAHIVTPETGALVSPASSDKLVEGILTIERNWESYEPSKIRLYCRQNFDLRVTCKSLERVYNEALGNK